MEKRCCLIGRDTTLRCKGYRRDGGRGIEEEVTAFIKGTKGAPHSKESPEIILASDPEGKDSSLFKFPSWQSFREYSNYIRQWLY